MIDFLNILQNSQQSERVRDSNPNGTFAVGRKEDMIINMNMNMNVVDRKEDMNMDMIKRKFLAF